MAHYRPIREIWPVPPGARGYIVAVRKTRHFHGPKSAIKLAVFAGGNWSFSAWLEVSWDVWAVTFDGQNLVRYSQGPLPDWFDATYEHWGFGPLPDDCVSRHCDRDEVCLDATSTP